MPAWNRQQLVPALASGSELKAELSHYLPQGQVASAAGKGTCGQKSVAETVLWGVTRGHAGDLWCAAKGRGQVVGSRQQRDNMARDKWQGGQV